MAVGLMDGEVERVWSEGCYCPTERAGARRSAEGRRPRAGVTVALLPRERLSLHRHRPGVILQQTMLGELSPEVERDLPRRGAADADHPGHRHRAQQRERLSQLPARQVRAVARRVLRHRAMAGQGRARSHQMPADAFLRACMRDVAWNFFYGWVNFDHVIGTRNHYGKVDMYAGTLQRHAEGGGRRLHRAVRRRPDHGDLQGDPARLGQRGLRSVRGAGRNRHGVRPQAGRQHRGDRAHPHRDQAHARPARAIRRCATTCRSTAPSPTSRRTSRRSIAEPGFEGPAARLQPVQVSSAAPTSPGIRRSRACARPRSSARRPRNTSCRSSTATTASNGSSSFATRSSGTSRQEHRRAARARHDEGGRRRRHAGRHPPPGLLDQALDALRLGERHATLERYESGDDRLIRSISASAGLVEHDEGTSLLEQRRAGRPQWSSDIALFQLRAAGAFTGSGPRGACTRVP